MVAGPCEGECIEARMERTEQLQEFQRILVRLNRNKGRSFILDPHYPDQPITISSTRLDFKVTEPTSRNPKTQTIKLDLLDFTVLPGKPKELSRGTVEEIERLLMAAWKKDNPA
jgi:hypothetical protein